MLSGTGPADFLDLYRLVSAPCRGGAGRCRAASAMFADCFRLLRHGLTTCERWSRILYPNDVEAAIRSTRTRIGIDPATDQSRSSARCRLRAGFDAPPLIPVHNRFTVSSRLTFAFHYSGRVVQRVDGRARPARRSSDCRSGPRCIRRSRWWSPDCPASHPRARKRRRAAMAGTARRRRSRYSSKPPAATIWRWFVARTSSAT